MENDNSVEKPLPGHKENFKNGKRKKNEDKLLYKNESNEKKSKTSLNLAISECGFQWDDKLSSNNNAAEESSSSEDDDCEELIKLKKKKLTPEERRELERKKEREIREREIFLASSKIPQTVEQFERLVIARPNSSIIWIHYMAYHLQATEFEKSRTIARRALKSINYTEDLERWNVWMAWLNLESRFGTVDSLNEVFQEAVRANDSQKVYSHMLTIHVEASRNHELEKIVNTMITKFKQNIDTWTDCGAALLKVGLKDKSRYIMQKALQCLPDNKHIDIMVKFAHLENKFGEKERSQTLFEQVLSQYPKRLDVWSAYVDSVVKSGDIDIARKVLSRAISQPLPAKKMKIILKKYLDFEKSYGTPESVLNVQELIMKYVEEQCNKTK